MTVDDKKLLATTDAMVWAEEFCSEFVVLRRDNVIVFDEDEDMGAGFMVGWFANAMCVASDAERRKIAESILGFPIKIDVDRLGEKK